MRNIKHFLSLLLSALTAIGLCLAFTSCEPEGLVDTSDFQLYYVSVTDIAPSQTPQLPIKPYYHNGTPSNFRIVEVTFEGDPVVLDAFSINAETGVFTVGKTNDLRIGKYSFTIACDVNGKTYEFPDAISFNLMKKVPDSIVCEPELITVTLADVVVQNPENELPTAKITAEESIKITGYSISKVRRGDVIVSDIEDMFEVSDEGEVSIIGGNEDFIPGKYVFDFKLTTALVDKTSEDGIFPEALTIDVTSAPAGLVYTPGSANVEAGSKASFGAPVLNGSLDEVVYSIAEVSKDGTAVTTDKITIDPASGAISVLENEFAEGERYTISVKVKNAYGENTFEDAFVVDIVGFIEPVGEFSYTPLKKVQEAAISHAPEAEVTGADVKFSFVDLPDYLADLSIDEESGEISAPQSNKLPIGYHVVKVRAENTKNYEETQFLLDIEKNPNEFSTVYWGTNLTWKDGTALSKTDVQGISQFRYYQQKLSCEIVESDIPEGVKVRYEIKNYGVSIVDKGDKYAVVSIDPTSGTITFDKGTSPAREIIIQKVIVTVGEGETSWVREFPVFFNLVLDDVKQGDGTDGICTVEYTPFVLGCNPYYGVISNVPVLKRVDEEDPDATFTMDYRSDFGYINLDGPESHGTAGIWNNATTPAPFFDDLLATYKLAVPTTNAGPGNKTLFSAILDENYVNIKPVYVQQDDLRVKVNPRIWRNDDGYANGIFMGKISVSATKSDPTGGGRHTPIAVWFDEKFQSNE